MLDNLDPVGIDRHQLPGGQRQSTLVGASSAVANEPKHPCCSTLEAVQAGIAIQRNDSGLLLIVFSNDISLSLSCRLLGGIGSCFSQSAVDATMVHPTIASNKQVPMRRAP